MRGIELLSLDFARPVYKELGVDVVCEETLRGVARDALLGRLAQQRQPFQLDVWGDPESTHSVWVAPFTSLIERALGLEDRARVEYWVKYMVCTEERNPWVGYGDLLGSWASAVRTNRGDRFGLSADVHAIAQRLKRMLNVSEIEEALNRQAGHRLTEWDLPRFERLGLSEIPEGSGFFPFVDQILLIIRNHRVQQFWQWLASEATPQDINAIGAAALARSLENGSRYTPPADLPLPIGEPTDGPRVQRTPGDDRGHPKTMLTHRD